MNYKQLNEALVKRMRVAVQSFVNDEWSKRFEMFDRAGAIRWATSMAVKHGLWHPDDDARDILWSKGDPTDVPGSTHKLGFGFFNSQMRKAMRTMKSEYIDIYAVCMILDDLAGPEDPLGKTMFIEPGLELAGVPYTYLNNYLMYQYLIESGIMERHHFYVLMGHDAIDVFDSDGIDTLIEEINGGLFYEITSFPDNYPPQLAIGKVSCDEWIFITKEEYDKLYNL